MQSWFELLVAHEALAMVCWLRVDARSHLPLPQVEVGASDATISLFADVIRLERALLSDRGQTTSSSMADNQVRGRWTYLDRGGGGVSFRLK